MASPLDKMLMLSIEQVFNAGKAAGAYEHHQRVVEFLQSIAPPAPDAEEEESGERASHAARRPLLPTKSGYGEISTALRRAVKENAATGGIAARDVPDWCRKQGYNVSANQARYGLKALLKRREVRTAENGKLIPGPAMAGKAGASAPVPE